MENFVVVQDPEFLIKLIFICVIFYQIPEEATKEMDRQLHPTVFFGDLINYWCAKYLNVAFKSFYRFDLACLDKA